MNTEQFTRVDNIQQAFDAGVPLYTANGQYRVRRVRNGVYANTREVALVPINTPPGLLGALTCGRRCTRDTVNM